MSQDEDIDDAEQHVYYAYLSDVENGCYFYTLCV